MRADNKSVDAGKNLGPGQPYVNSLEHVLGELERIDLLIQFHVHQARKTHLGDPEFQGLCISEQEVDSLLAKPCGLPRWAENKSSSEHTLVRGSFEQLRSAANQRKSASQSLGICLRLDELARLFDLTPLDIDILLVCLAPEMDLRYEKLYAYLQDDVTKKRASVDLILNLLCPTFEAKLDTRSRFANGSPLIDRQIIQLFVDPSQPEPPLLRKYCKLDERIASFLLGLDEIDARLRALAALSRSDVRFNDVHVPDEVKERLLRMTRMTRENGQRAALYFQGPPGTSKQSVAEALCQELGISLLVVEGKELLENADPGFEAGVRLLMREAMLQHSAVYWRGFDPLLGDGKAIQLNFMLSQLTAGPVLSFLGGETVWQPGAGQLVGTAFVRVMLPALPYVGRVASWERFLEPAQRATDVDLTMLSSRFRLNAGAIKGAAATALNLARWHDPKDGRVTMDDLYTACRLHSNRKLASLALKVEPRYTLEDIVVPQDQMTQLKEMCNQARYRHIVYADWGFDRKLSVGKGLNALFSGPPGTGKTMAAEVIANELRLDLYKIDLSQIVSKYIGETEKNLDQIFREANGSNAILFFDEADALFGKRSEVKDAHDRYANIEVGYLLQKMEEYEGIAILATNLRQNLDEAFVRRMHLIVEFPFPDEENRRRIWQGAFPHEAPVSGEVDFGVLAREIRLAGGNIKNIALAAAFYAASDGKIVRMPHLLQAAHREHQKLGRTWNESDWKMPSRASHGARSSRGEEAHSLISENQRPLTATAPIHENESHAATIVNPLP